MCFGILVVMVWQKFFEGAWVTMVVTALLIAACFGIQRHYRMVGRKITKLTDQLIDLPIPESTGPQNWPLDPAKPTAILLVSRYNGLGVHSVYSIMRQFNGHFPQVVFASVAVIDSGAFKGHDEVARMEQETETELRKYVALAESLQLRATSRMAVGTDPVEAAESLFRTIAAEYAQSVIFGGKLVFRRDSLWQRLLHNETAAAIQRRNGKVSR